MQYVVPMGWSFHGFGTIFENVTANYDRQTYRNHKYSSIILLQIKNNRATKKRMDAIKNAKKS